MDAEERKAELMAQNKMSDGRMFKLDFDPRVIGNKILPDGSRKTGIGEFIRKTSLDEFPQFWNVLNGTMSLVGTRPILQDELLKYELHHRARIAIKPGITGMWQVSGRSDITDFEEVVRLDTEYISNWNFGLDIQYSLQLLVLWLFKDYYLYVIVLLATQALTNIATAMCADRIYPQFKPKGQIAAEEKKAINNRIKDLFTSKIGGIIYDSADTIVISSFLATFFSAMITPPSYL